MDELTKGMVFDLHRDGHKTVRVMALSKNKAIELDTLADDEIRIHEDIDVENEVEEIVINDILTEDKMITNMEAVSTFMDHYKNETGNVIADAIFLSFYGA